MPPPMIVRAYQPIRGKIPPKVIEETKKVEIKELFSAEKLIKGIEGEIREELSRLWSDYIINNKEHYDILHKDVENPYICKLKYHKLKLESYQFVHFLTEIQKQLEYLRQVSLSVYDKFTTGKNVKAIFDAEVIRLGEYFNLFRVFVEKIEQHITDKKAKKIDEGILEKMNKQVQALGSQLEGYANQLEKL